MSEFKKYAAHADRIYAPLTDTAWEEFKAGDLCVVVKNEKEADEFLKLCEEHDIHWGNEETATAFNPCCGALHAKNIEIICIFVDNVTNHLVYHHADIDHMVFFPSKYIIWGDPVVRNFGQTTIADSGDRRKPTAYRENIIALIDRQHDKGLSKYGVTLEENTTLSSTQRIEHAEEELVDALQYLEHLKAAVSDSLTANDYQRMAMRTALGMDYGEKEENGLLLNGLMGLNGEAGECIDIMKKHIFQGHELDREHLIEELGDCAWYLAVSCEGLSVTLEEVMKRNVDKLMKRYPEGFDKARSINRKGEND